MSKEYEGIIGAFNGIRIMISPFMDDDTMHISKNTFLRIQSWTKDQVPHTTMTDAETTRRMGLLNDS